MMIVIMIITDYIRCEVVGGDRLGVVIHQTCIRSKMKGSAYY